MRVTVKDLKSGCRVLAGRSGLARDITSAQVVAPDLSSLMTAMTPDRGVASSVVHILPGQIAYLSSLPGRERLRLVRTLVKQKPACIILSGGAVCGELLDTAESSGIPVLKTGNVPKLARLLMEKLTPRISLHGVLVQIFGLGTLIIGESAVGKSEAALDLVLRGHKFAADDVVLLEKTGGEISGRATELGTDLLQIRGLGVINIRVLYGDSATVTTSTVGLVVELEEWQKGHHYSLVGMHERRFRILGVNLPFLKLPVKPGRNMATLIEVAARNQMLKQRGIFTARDLGKRLKKRLVG
jgi:HPr kinase/phosphorylase